MDLAYTALSEAIYAHRLPPGARLSIDELCRELEMSATPVREALSRAVALDLVQQDNNHGFWVAPDISPSELRQLFAVRRALELEALSKSSVVPGAADRLASLAVRMDGLERGSRSRDILRFTRLDHDFHRELVVTAGNRFLLRAWEGLHFHLHVHRVYIGAGVVDMREAGNEHSAIVQAATDGDPDRLSAAVRMHIDAAEARLSRLSQPAG